MKWTRDLFLFFGSALICIFPVPARHFPETVGSEWLEIVNNLGGQDLGNPIYVSGSTRQRLVFRQSLAATISLMCRQPENKGRIAEGVFSNLEL